MQSTIETRVVKVGDFVIIKEEYIIELHCQNQLYFILFTMHFIHTTTPFTPMYNIII